MWVSDIDAAVDGESTGDGVSAEGADRAAAVARYAAEQPVVRPFADCCYRHGRRVTIPESDRAT